ncbi:hypothetical protein AYO21_09264 [Fonsecaea monophora]|uniref:Uncharacterized protein n=1 Tax=Fonsecaea monophora TaxID=254056 RepID=A0A177EWW1_9EURO|nr:hypothetical protein AYO21_09264 [Fonsecaea monophora]OAG36533.1 hypothetical protein AYO21_09264 [Fonsecaea monophora]
MTTRERDGKKLSQTTQIATQHPTECQLVLPEKPTVKAARAGRMEEAKEDRFPSTPILTFVWDTATMITWAFGHVGYRDLTLARSVVDTGGGLTTTVLDAERPPRSRVIF